MLSDIFKCRFDLMSLVMMFVAPFTALWGFLSAMLGFGGQNAVTSTAATSSGGSGSGANMRNEQTRIARQELGLAANDHLNFVL